MRSSLAAQRVPVRFPKPWNDGALPRIIGDSPDPLAAIKAAARTALGRLSLTDAIRTFRNEMVDSALDQGSGSRRAAARMLGVTRPAVQHILRQHKSDDSS